VEARRFRHQIRNSISIADTSNATGQSANKITEISETKLANSLRPLLKKIRIRSSRSHPRRDRSFFVLLSYHLLLLMNRISSLSLLAVLASIIPATAVEQTLIQWNHEWKYFHPMSDDPSLDDALIDNTGAGAAPTIGPDLIFPGFNTGTSAWWQPEAIFTGAGGYATTIGKGFNIDGIVVGDPALNYSSYDGGLGPGPIGYDLAGLAYFADPAAELTAFGTTLTQTPANRRFGAYYRTTINTTQEYTRPRLRMLLDDSAIIYIDGVLVARVNRSANTIVYSDATGSDTTATNNETGVSAGNENVIQSLFLDNAGDGMPGAQADAFVVAPLPKLTIGTHTIAILVRNSGVNSSDQAFGLQLRADDAGISASVSNVTRLDGGTPLNVSDDTYSFDVVLTKINLPGVSTWTSNNAAANGPTAGSYAQPIGTYTYTFPAQASNTSPVNTNVITFADTSNPLVTTQVSVTAPEAPSGAPLVLSPASPMLGTGFEEAPISALSFVRKIFNTELAFTSASGAGVDSPGGTNLPGGVYRDNIIAETNNTWRSIGSAGSWTSESIGLAPSIKGLKVSLKVRSFTTSATVFEADDFVRFFVETSTDGILWTERGNVLPVLNGSNDSTANPAGDRIIVLTGEDAASLNAANYVTLMRTAIPVGAGAAFVRLRYENGGTPSGSENILIDDIKLEIGVDPDADPDNDGITNVEEEIRGSDPIVPNLGGPYVSHMAVPGAVPGDTRQTIVFPTGSPFHKYTLRTSPDLTTWTDTVIFGTNANFTFTEDSPLTRRFWYVVQDY
jgi:hypothetical protein